MKDTLLFGLFIFLGLSGYGQSQALPADFPKYEDRGYSEADRKAYDQKKKDWYTNHLTHVEITQDDSTETPQVYGVFSFINHYPRTYILDGLGSSSSNEEYLQSLKQRTKDLLSAPISLRIVSDREAVLEKQGLMFRLYVVEKESKYYLHSSTETYLILEAGNYHIQLCPQKPLDCQEIWQFNELEFVNGEKIRAYQPAKSDKKTEE